MRNRWGVPGMGLVAWAIMFLDPRANDFAIAAATSPSPKHAFAAFLGEKPWTEPMRLQVRATAYRPDGKSATGIRSRYATESEAGTAAVPYWISKGSLIRIQTPQGPRVFLAVDHGKKVEARTAARTSGITAAQKKAAVIDFCAPSQYWKDRKEVEIFQYTGSIPFEKLTPGQKEEMLRFSSRYIKGPDL